MTDLKPLLKWAGGKTWLAPKLKELYEPYRNTHVWVEPFCGALGATLGVMPDKALLIDSNQYVINLYRYIQSGGKNIVADWENSKENYYEIRKKFNNFFCLGYEWESLAFYWLNHHCYNGLCRFNQKGEFNVPYGKYKNPKINHDFSQYEKAFKNWEFFSLEYKWEFFSLDYKESLIWIEPNSFLYIDPPYDDGFVGYQGDGFTWNDQVYLANRLGELKCPVVASNKATERVLDLYKANGFDIEIIEAPRRISCKGDRKPVLEMLATKNLSSHL